MTQLPELMSVKELQNYLGIGKDKAYELVKNKSFPAIKIGGRYYIVITDFAEWLERQKAKQRRSKAENQVIITQNTQKC